MRRVAFDRWWRAPGGARAGGGPAAGRPSLAPAQRAERRARPPGPRRHARARSSSPSSARSTTPIWWTTASAPTPGRCTTTGSSTARRAAARPVLTAIPSAPGRTTACTPHCCRADRVIAALGTRGGRAGRGWAWRRLASAASRSGWMPTYIRAVPDPPGPGRAARPGGARRPAPFVLFIGQLKIRKGYDVLARAMPLVSGAPAPAARFVFAGQNPAQAAELERHLRGQRQPRRRCLLGPVSEGAKVRLLRRAACWSTPRATNRRPAAARSDGRRLPGDPTDMPVVRE